MKILKQITEDRSYEPPLETTHILGVFDDDLAEKIKEQKHLAYKTILNPSYSFEIEMIDCKLNQRL